MSRTLHALMQFDEELMFDGRVCHLRGLMYVTANLTMRGFESHEGQVMNSLEHTFRSTIIQSWLKIT